MRRIEAVEFEFVEYIPSTLRGGIIYISIRYRTTAHLCLDGCGEKVVHPLRPNQWRLTYDGATISLAPSIGNAGLACRSHYWIERSKVRWCAPLTDDDIEFAIERDGWGVHPVRVAAEPTVEVEPKIGWFQRLWRALPFNRPR